MQALLLAIRLLVTLAEVEVRRRGLEMPPGTLDDLRQTAHALPERTPTNESTTSRKDDAARMSRTSKARALPKRSGK